MATRQGEGPGEVVDYEFVQEISDDLTCSICMKVLCQPHLVNCCEQQFCKSCLEKWSKTNKSCPHCRSTDFVKVLLKQKSRKIGELKVYCPNKKHGCESILKISEYDNHLSTTNAKGCQYVLLNCPYKCTNQLNIHRCQMKKHQENQCPRRPVNCVHCKLEGEHQVITGDHLKTCPLYPLDCPQQCGATILRKNLEAHKTTCPEELVECPFRELGCKVKVHRKDLEKHVETSAVQHMTVLAQSHLSLKAEHAALKAENEALKKTCREVNTKLKTAGAVLKNLQNNPQVAKMYPLLVDTSELTMGTWLVLSLSETNMESGHHYFIVSKYKFKLEWQRQQDHVLQHPGLAVAQQHPGFAVAQRVNVWDDPVPVYDQQTQETYLLKLYLVLDDTHPPIAESWSCDVKMTSPSQNLAVICKGKSLTVHSDQKEAAGHLLLGTSKQYCSHDLQIQFDNHNTYNCQCHPYEEPDNYYYEEPDEQEPDEYQEPYEYDY